MSTVSEQLRAKQGTKPATGTAAAKPGTPRPAGTKPGTRPAGAKPAGARPAAGGAKPPTASPKPATPTPAPEPAAPQVAKFEGTLEEWKALTPADRAAQSDEVKAYYKELKKKAAFAALKERGKAKRAANVAARTQAMTALQAELEVGQHMFATRASYYGVEVEILGFDEKRGRNLVHVKLLTTKKGRALDEDKQGERWFSAKFLQEERPTEPYVRRRPTEVHGTDTAEPAEDEAGVEEEEFTDESGEDEEGDAEDEDDADEDVEEEGDVEDESELEEGDEEDDTESDETDESWG